MTYLRKNCPEIEAEMASIAAMLNKSEKSQNMAAVTEEMVTQYIGVFKGYVPKARYKC